MYLFAGVARSMVDAITDPIGLHHADLVNNVLGQRVTEAAFIVSSGTSQHSKDGICHLSGNFIS